MKKNIVVAVSIFDAREFCQNSCVKWDHNANPTLLPSNGVSMFQCGSWIFRVVCAMINIFFLQIKETVYNFYVHVTYVTTYT